MTIVRVLAKTPTDGVPAPAEGELRWRQTARRVIPADGIAPAAIVLPGSFTVPLVAGSAEVDVEPSMGVWVWSVIESFDGSPARRRYLAVPDEVTVDYADLVELDPDSLDPAPSLDPAWAAPLAELASRTVTPDPDHPGFYLIGA